MIYRRPEVPISGWMSLVELQWLYNTAKKYKTIVEIGSWKGRSTHALLSGALLGGGTVTSVDHFEGTEVIKSLFPKEVINVDIYHVFMSNLSRFPNLKVLKMSSEEGAKKVKSAEMIFVDGDHSYDGVIRDIDAWQPKVTKLLCGHDYSFPEVKKAVIERFGLPKVIDTIWYVPFKEQK